MARFISVCVYIHVCTNMYTCVFSMYVIAAVLPSKNENVGHAATSERLVLDLRRPDRRTPMKVLVKKTFTFVESLWASHVQKNMQNLL